MATPGVVVVFTELGPNTTEAEYHAAFELGLTLGLATPQRRRSLTRTEMYETEHCPPRMALPEFVQGVRYRAADGLTPTWAGLFHVSDISVASSPAVQAISASRSAREIRISADYAAADRRLYRLAYDSGDAPVGAFLIAVALTHPDPSEIEKWHNEHHLAMIRAIPGWVRTRRYLLVGGQRTGLMYEGRQGGIPTVFVIHEWSREDAFASEEFESALRSDPRREAILKASTDLERRIFKLHKVL